MHGRESQILERFYDRFFARHPEVSELFGEHSVNEREEMLRETLASVVANLHGEPWLKDNLEAMGKSHAEYGVEWAMYGWYVETMLDTLEEVAGTDWKTGCRTAWRNALERLTDTMRLAGTRAGACGPEVQE